MDFIYTLHEWNIDLPLIYVVCVCEWGQNKWVSKCVGGVISPVSTVFVQFFFPWQQTACTGRAEGNVALCAKSNKWREECTHARVCVCMCVCTCVCAHACVHMHMCVCVTKESCASVSLIQCVMFLANLKLFFFLLCHQIFHPHAYLLFFFFIPKSEYIRAYLCIISTLKRLKNKSSVFQKYLNWDKSVIQLNVTVLNSGHRVKLFIYTVGFLYDMFLPLIACHFCSTV